MENDYQGEEKNSCSIDLSSPPPPPLRALSRSSLFPKRIKKGKSIERN
jgi:hypothetical protein